MPPSVSDADKYKKAKTLRLVEINRIKETLDIAKSAKQDDSLRPVFIQRYKYIDTIFETFSKHHNTILSLSNSDETEFLTEDQIRKDFEMNFLSTKAIYHSITAKNMNNDTQTDSDQ